MKNTEGNINGFKDLGSFTYVFSIRESRYK
jgi:hypothetical protein